VSEQFGLFSLITMLGSANRGQWGESGRIFIPLDFVSDMPAMDFDTREQHGIGNVTGTRRGNSVATIRFQSPCPLTERRRCSKFLPDYIRLPLSGVPAPIGFPHDHLHGGMLALSETDVAFLTLAKENWIRRFGSLQSELDAILSGRYCIAKSENVITLI
jgi:hypothetical protein